MDQKREIITNISRHASSRYFSQFLGFFTSTLMRRFLGHYYMGIWQILGVILGYSTWANLGTENAVFYKLPMARGSGDDAEAENVKNVVFSFVACVSIALSSLTLVIALIMRTMLPRELFIGLLAVSALIVLQRVYTYHVMLLRANKNFTVLSLSIAFDAAVNLLLVIFFVSHMRLYGLYIVVMAMPVLNVMFIRLFSPYQIRYDLKLNKLISYIRFGLPIFLGNVVDQLLKSIDKIMIAKMMGLVPVGLYSLTSMATNYTTEASKNFSIVITPYFLEDYGKSKDIRKVSKYLVTSAEIMSCFMATLLGAIYLAVPVFVTHILPQFKDGIMAMRISLLAAFFQMASPQSTNFLIAVDKQMRLLVILGLGLLVNIVGNYLLLSHGYGISGASAATALSSLIIFLITTVYSMAHFAKMREMSALLLKIAFSLIFSITVCLLLERFVVYPHAVLETLMRLTLFILFSAPLIVATNRKTRVLNIMVSIVKDRLFKKI